MGDIYGGGEPAEGVGIEHTTAIQHSQTLWLGRRGLCVSHSNSKRCVIEEAVREGEPLSREAVCRVLVGSLVLGCEAAYNVDCCIEGLLPSALRTCPAITELNWKWGECCAACASLVPASSCTGGRSK